MVLMPTFFNKFSGIQSDAMEMNLSDFIFIDFCDTRAGTAFQNRKSSVVAGFREPHT